MSDQIPFQYALTDGDYIDICAGKGTDKFEFTRLKQFSQLFAEKRQKTQLSEQANLSFALNESKELYKQTLSQMSPQYRLYMKNIQYLQDQKKNLTYKIENAEQLQMKEKIDVKIIPTNKQKYLHQQIHKLDRSFRKKKISAADIIDVQPKSKQNYYREMRNTFINSLNKKKILKESLYNNENIELEQKQIFQPENPVKQNNIQITISTAKDHRFPSVSRKNQNMQHYSTELPSKKYNNLPTSESFKSDAINTPMSKVTVQRTKHKSLKRLERQNRQLNENNQISNFDLRQNTMMEDDSIQKKSNKQTPERQRGVSIKVWLSNLNEKASSLIKRCQFEKEDNRQFGQTWKDSSQEFTKILEQYDCFLDLIKEQGLGKDDNFQKVMDYHFANLIQNFKYEKADFFKFKQEYYKHKWAQLQLYFDVDNEQRRKFLESKRKRQISLI